MDALEQKVFDFSGHKSFTYHCVYQQHPALSYGIARMYTGMNSGGFGGGGFGGGFGGGPLGPMPDMSWHTNPPEQRTLSVTPFQVKIFEPQLPTPLLRIDREPHHGLPRDHLQFGQNTFTGRHGEDAYNLLGDVVTNMRRTTIKMPWETDDKKW